MSTSPTELDDIRRVAKTALQHWGDSVSEPILLKHRENTVFKVRDNSGNAAVLRVHRPGYHDRNALASELAWMSMLSLNGFELPQPIAALNGQLLVEVEDTALGPRHLDMLSWMQGVPLGDLGVPLTWTRERLRTIFFELGRSTARLHRISGAWELPPDFKRHAWDRDGLLGDLPFWGPFWALPELTGEQRGLIAEFRQVAMRRLDEYHRGGGGYGLIHSDLVRENILVDGDIVRLIDFDDAGFGWHMFEIATILHKNRWEPDYPVIEDAVLAGYAAEGVLRQEDITALPLFLALRSLTYLGWVDERRDEPGIAEKIAPHIADAEDLCRSLLQTA